VSLKLAFKGLIVVVAVMFGTMANAFAHGGHDHAGMAPASSMVTASGATASLPVAAQISVTISKLTSSNSRALIDSDQSAKPPPSHSDGAICTSGACCCQGASSCGMSGHCCASTIPSQSDWTRDLSNHMRYHLARLGWVYPDIIIGLDRPPKV
jgi:hypothetical protein